MRIFANKNIWKKIVVIFVLITSLSFVTPKPVAAGIGGELMEPICELLVGFGDGVVNIVHSLLVKQDMTLIRVDLNNGILGFIRAALTVLAAALVIAGIVAATGGIGVVVLAITKGVAVSALGTGAIALGALTAIGSVIPFALESGVYIGAKVYGADVWDNEVDLPLYSVSPEEIFANRVPLFNVNFFNPDSEPMKYSFATEVSDELKKANYEQILGNDGGDYRKKSDADTKLSIYGVNVDTVMAKHIVEVVTTSPDSKNYYYQLDDDKGIIKLNVCTDTEVTGVLDAGYRVYYSSDIVEATNFGEGEIYSFSYELQSIVSKWYFALRMIAIVGMMSVLVYIGIRIVISSTSSQKAKYKQLMGDWLVGMVLLFTMHYIMSFANMFVDKITDLLSGVNPGVHVAIMEDTDNKIEEKLKDAGISVTDSQEAANQDEQLVYKYTGEDGKKYIEWHTNLMGHLRIRLRENANNSDAFIGYTIMFIVMIIYLIIFCWTYIKRVICMAFLTLISPMVALTYPIDKANDGSAQGFNYWFKEYMFNLLLQPMHLLIYTVLISSAIELALENWIYALVAMGFIASAEKLVRQMFNFSKASTPGVFGGAAGAALTMSGMRWLFGHGPKGGKGGAQGIGGKGSEKDAEGKEITSNGETLELNSAMSKLVPETDSVDSAVKGKENKTKSASEDTSINTGQPESYGGDASKNDQPSNNFRNQNDNAFEEMYGYGAHDYWDTFDKEVEKEKEKQKEMEKSEWVEKSNLSKGNTERGQFFNDWKSTKKTKTNSNNEFEGLSTEDRLLAKRKFGNENVGGISNLAAIKAIRAASQDGRKRRIGQPRPGNKGFEGRLTQNDLDQYKVKQANKAARADAWSTYKDGMANKFKRSLANANPVGALGKMATGAAAAAAFGAVGVAAGVASGDASNVAKMGGAAVAGGYKLGSGAFSATSNALQVDGVGDAYERARLGEEEYKKQVAARNQKRKAEDEATIRLIQEKMKVRREEAKKLAQEWAPVYMNQKINDVSDWIYLEKMQKQKVEGLNRNYTREEAIGAYQINKRYDIEHKVGEEKKHEVMQQIMEDNKLDENAARIYYNAAKVFDNVKNG